jgi:hypothetical protein
MHTISPDIAQIKNNSKKLMGIHPKRCAVNQIQARAIVVATNSQIAVFVLRIKNKTSNTSKAPITINLLKITFLDFIIILRKCDSRISFVAFVC